MAGRRSGSLSVSIAAVAAEVARSARGKPVLRPEQSGAFAGEDAVGGPVEPRGGRMIGRDAQRARGKKQRSPSPRSGGVCRPLDQVAEDKRHGGGHHRPRHPGKDRQRGRPRDPARSGAVAWARRACAGS
jgi:hypothetical protein